MPRQVNIQEAKAHLSKLIEQTQAGEEIVIARAGKPVAKLVPLARQKPVRKLGLLDGKLRIPDHFNELLSDELLEQFEGRR